eukprot:m.129746 g.129746  ORF g.129746 m.129746 type:complete len:342 (+) comp19957_c0_seq3:1398-2423(+)
MWRWRHQARPHCYAPGCAPCCGCSPTGNALARCPTHTLPAGCLRCGKQQNTPHSPPQTPPRLLLASQRSQSLPLWPRERREGEKKTDTFFPVWHRPRLVCLCSLRRPLMAEPRFTLGYWKIRGLASSCRLALWLAGYRDFEDRVYTVSKKEDGSWDRSSWLSVKPTMPLDFANLPFLLDREAGVNLTQSAAILRYVARQHKDKSFYEGEGPLAVHLDMLLEQAYDMQRPFTRTCYSASSQDELTSYRETVLKGHLDILEKYLEKQNGPYLTGKLTFVDVFLCELLDQMAVLLPGSLSGHAKVAALHKTFWESPDVAAFKASKYYMEGPVNNLMAYCNNVPQ